MQNSNNGTAECEEILPAKNADGVSADTCGERVGEESAQPADLKSAKQSDGKGGLAGYFTATRLAYIAIFTAISYGLRFGEIPLLPAVPFLKLDFSNIFPLIGAYALGPVAGMTIGILKEVLWMFNSSTACVGELANILVMLPFVLIPGIVYKYRKGLKSVIIFIVIGSLVQVAWSFPVNWLLNFPVFSGFDWGNGMSFFMGVWYWVVLFNLIKDVALAVIVILLYKPVSRLIKFTNAKFTKKSRV